MDIKNRSEWTIGRSIVTRARKGSRRANGGQIIWKGPKMVVELTQDGEQRKVKRDRFLVRVAKVTSQTVVGTSSDALRKLHELLGKQATGSLGNQSQERFASFLRKTYLPGRIAAGCSQKTVQIYRDDIEHHIIPALGRRTLKGITRRHLQDFVNDLRLTKGLDPKTIANIHGVASAALTEAEKDERIPSNPARHVELPKLSNEEKLAKESRAEAKAWSGKEAATFLDVVSLNEEMGRWGMVGATTGMRPGEQCARKWSDLSDDRLTISSSVVTTDKARRAKDPTLPKWELAVPKTRCSRTIKLTPECCEVLRLQRQHVEQMKAADVISAEAAEYIFPSQGGPNPYTNPDRIYERWRYLINGDKNRRGGARLPLQGVRFIPLYGLRHTHATHLLRHGWNLKYVAKRLGTSVEMIEKHYGHVLRDIEDEAIDGLPPISSK